MSLRLFAVSVRTAAHRAVAERGGLLVAVGFYLLVVSALSALWRAAAGANGGQVVGYSAVALTWYIATSEAATVSLNIRLIEEIGDEIASGAVASELLRPASVLGVRVASEIGRALPRLLAFVVLGSALAGIAGGRPPNPAALVLVVPSLLLAVSCNLLAQHAFAGAAFWVRDARSTWFLYHKFVFILGGMLLPLQVLPAALKSIAMVLPFMAMSYAPARLASGHVEPQLLAIQAVWLAVLWAVATAVFAAGERRLQVVGG